MRWATTEAKHSITVFTSDLERFSGAGLLKLLVGPSERLGHNIKLIHGAPSTVDGNLIPELERMLRARSGWPVRKGLRTDLVLAPDSDHAVLFGDRAGEATGQQRLYSSRIGMGYHGELLPAHFPLPIQFLPTPARITGRIVSVR